MSRGEISLIFVAIIYVNFLEASRAEKCLFLLLLALEMEFIKFLGGPLEASFVRPNEKITCSLKRWSRSCARHLCAVPAAPRREHRSSASASASASASSRLALQLRMAAPLVVVAPHSGRSPGRGDALLFATLREPNYSLSSLSDALRAGGPGV